MSGVRKISFIIAVAICIGFATLAIYNTWFRPTRILVVNPLPAQAAEIVLNNDSRHIKVECREMAEASGFDDYDAVVMFGRGLYLDSMQMVSLDKAIRKGVPVFTNTLRNFSYVVTGNLDSLQCARMQEYFSNPCSANYRNMLRYISAIATPNRIGERSFAPPVVLPSDMFYHLEAGRYFGKAEELTEHLRESSLYNPGGKNIAFVSGVNFPVENNRAHIDTLVSRLTRAGYNVYPITATGKRRADMILSTDPDAIVYLPMGRLGNDSLINRLYDLNVPLFMPFPLIQSRQDWLDVSNPLGGGTLNARIVVPEIDGAMTPLCISTQNPSPDGYLLYTPEQERVDAFMEQFTRFMALRDKPNSRKKIAIGYFKSPGKDALLASGMEVVPSLYNFLKRLRSEGYDVSGLPPTLSEFRSEIMAKGSVMGSYAPAAQEKFMADGDPVWISATEYEKWAREVLLPEKYDQVEALYGKDPGSLLARGDSMAVAAIRYGNILLIPQTSPALGYDDFKLVHGAEVAPPHS
ncbi:MAG: cobaltochelatase subunit CobN [Paramuribaculum sp.]|nr:cobaltochelatase subunit CobN [Paramuribaculum sp.]